VRKLFGALLLVLFLALMRQPRKAGAYAVFLHDLLPRRALADSRAPSGRAVGRDSVAAPNDADLGRFRLWLYQRAAALPDTGLARAFLRRYPTAGAFDAAALKSFIMADPEARVLGVDSFAAVYQARDRRSGGPYSLPAYQGGGRQALLDLLSLGSRFVDLDRRNQNRILRRSDGRVALALSGDTVPFDPMTLNMGRLTGLSSQAHAHYGLSNHPKSAEAEVHKREPWNFAVAIGWPGDVETYADANAQLYTDLAVLALLSRLPGSSGLSALYAGAAMHYIADVGNPVHTLQAGIYEIYVDATTERWKRRALRLFGLLGPTPSRNSIGVDILTNLHTLSEALFKHQLESALRRPDSVPPSMHQALAALDAGNSELRASLTRVLRSLRTRENRSPDFGRAVTAALIEAGLEDGSRLYRYTRALATTELRRGGAVVDFDTVPGERIWEFVRAPGTTRTRATLTLFNEVQGRCLGRTVEALRMWWGQYATEAFLSPPDLGRRITTITARLVRDRLAYLDAADRRREAWLAQHGGLAVQ
jgi:hypothetical protein